LPDPLPSPEWPNNRSSPRRIAGSASFGKRQHHQHDIRKIDRLLPSQQKGLATKTVYRRDYAAAPNEKAKPMAKSCHNLKYG